MVFLLSYSDYERSWKVPLLLSYTERSWKVPLLRNPNDWEAGVVVDFLHTLGSNLPHSEHGDRMI